MIVLIAEKPSVAKDIARIIGATQKNDGYLSGIGCYNNLVALVEYLFNHFQLFQHTGVCLVAFLGFHLTGD